MLDLPWLFIARFVVPLIVGCVATGIDLRERRIPNWLTIPLLFAGLLFRGISEGGSGLLDSVAGVGVGFGIFFFLWITGGSAGGDVKFMAAVGAWLGPYHTFMVIIYSAVLLALCMSVLLLSRVMFGNRTSAAPQAESKGKTAGSTKSGKLLAQVVPYALPATLAILLRLAHLLLIGRNS